MTFINVLIISNHAPLIQNLAEREAAFWQQKRHEYRQQHDHAHNEQATTGVTVSTEGEPRTSDMSLASMFASKFGISQSIASGTSKGGKQHQQDNKHLQQDNKQPQTDNKHHQTDTKQHKTDNKLHHADSLPHQSDKKPYVQINKNSQLTVQHSTCKPNQVSGQ